MENIIFILIWVGIVVFKVVSSAKKKKAGKPDNDDWLDEQWQELIQTAEKQVEPQKKAGAPPPLPREKAPAARSTPAQHAPLPSEMGQRPAPRTQIRAALPPAQPRQKKSKVTPPPVQPVVARAPKSEPESTRFTPSSASSLALSGSSIAATSTNADRIARRQAGMKELISGKKALRKAIIMREILDRPRAYDA